MTTKKDAFARFGVKQKNEIWSWSGLSEDKSTVVLTVWSDQCEWNKVTKSFQWSTFGCDNDRWIYRTGNKARIQDIEYALSNHEGRFRAIRIDPQKELLPERSIKAVHPVMHLEWLITDFDPLTGECSGRSIPERRPFTH